MIVGIKIGWLGEDELKSTNYLVTINTNSRPYGTLGETPSKILPHLVIQVPFLIRTHGL